jgi:hypothetical protein
MRKCKALPKMSRAVHTADEIAGLASQGKDVSVFFTNRFTVVRPDIPSVLASSGDSGPRQRPSPDRGARV